MPLMMLRLLYCIYFPDRSFGEEGRDFFSLAGSDVVDPLFKKLLKNVDPDRIFKFMTSKVESADFERGRGNLCLTSSHGVPTAGMFPW